MLALNPGLQPRERYKHLIAGRFSAVWPERISLRACLAARRLAVGSIGRCWPALACGGRRLTRPVIQPGMIIGEMSSAEPLPTIHDENRELPVPGLFCH